MSDVVAVDPTAVPRLGITRLYRDATSMAMSSILTATLGIGFWILCGRLIPPDLLGVQTAILSVISAPAIVVASGVGDAFTAIIPVAGRDRQTVIARGYRLVVLASATAGVAAAFVAVTFLPQLRGSFGAGITVFAGVLVWSLFVVQDPALTSMGRARWLPVENGAVSLLKLTVLPLLIFLGTRYAAVVASLLPALLAVVVLYPQVRRLSRQESSPSVAVTDLAGVNGPRELPRLVARTMTSVGLSLGTLTIVPFLVTAAAGPTQGAVFALCLTALQALDSIGSSLGVSLVVHASARGSESGRMAVAVFRRTLLIIGVGAVGLTAISPFALRFVNPVYLDMHGVLVIGILAFGSTCRTLYVIWAALQRARRRMGALLTLNAVASVFVFATVSVFSHRWGAVGGAVVICAAQVLLSCGAAIHLVRAGRKEMK